MFLRSAISILRVIFGNFNTELENHNHNRISRTFLALPPYIGLLSLQRKKLIKQQSFSLKKFYKENTQFSVHFGV